MQVAVGEGGLVGRGDSVLVAGVEETDVRSHSLPWWAGGVSGGDAHRRRGGFATVFRGL